MYKKRAASRQENETYELKQRPCINLTFPNRFYFILIRIQCRTSAVCVLCFMYWITTDKEGQYTIHFEAIQWTFCRPNTYGTLIFRPLFSTTNFPLFSSNGSSLSISSTTIYVNELSVKLDFNDRVQKTKSLIFTIF